MKPCSKNRKLIAWLVLDSLDTEDAVALRRHLEDCEGCRCYQQELSSVAKALKGADLKTDVQATAAFHREVSARITPGEPTSVRAAVQELLRATFLNWRVALPVAGAFALVILAWQLSSQRPDVPQRRSSSPALATAIQFDRDLLPTISNYRIVANHSLEQLDQLLNDQARRRLPPVPLYTASTLTANLPD
jgi:anti-sigma factor RsiW